MPPKPRTGKQPPRTGATKAASEGGFKVPRLPKHKSNYKRKSNRLKKETPKCGAKRKDGSGGHCGKGAGWGTDHKGHGRCRLHGGSTPTHVKAAATEEHRRLLGVPRDIHPLEALLECIRIRAGEVTWLSNRMADLDEDAWVEQTIVGKQFHLYAKERQAAMNDLARFSQMAISLGIADRAVKLQEMYGEMIARVLQNIFDDLKLTPAQKAQAPLIIRRHLIAIDGGQKELVA